MTDAGDTPDGSLLLTYDEARRKIGVSISQLYRLMRQGKIRKLELAPQVRRISLAECERYVSELETEQYGEASGDAGRKHSAA
jgi:hypothetical protein